MTPPPATPEQLAADVRADAAQRAASGAARLDYSHGALTKAENWTGMDDGSATCEITSTARLLAVPRPTDRDGYNSRTFLLARDGEEPVQIHTVAELAALLDGPAPAAAQPADADSEDGDGYPWAALGQDLAIAELLPADTDADADADFDTEGGADEDEDVDQEAEAHAAGLL
ncbi:hypothetical protein ACW14Y_42720 (plasmid) [Kitasatospora sp. cg17-2]